MGKSTRSVEDKAMGEEEWEWEARILKEELGDALHPDGSIDFENLETVHIPFDELEAGLDDE